MTLIFSTALIRVGASVTPSIGSTSTREPRVALAQRGQRGAGALLGVLEAEPRPSSSSRGPSVTSKPGWRAAIASSSGAIFSSALSPIAGIDAWPADALGRDA